MNWGLYVYVLCVCVCVSVWFHLSNIKGLVFLSSKILYYRIPKFDSFSLIYFIANLFDSRENRGK